MISKIFINKNDYYYLNNYIARKEDLIYEVWVDNDQHIIKEKQYPRKVYK